MNDTVNHPEHYGGKDNTYEVIKVIEAWKLDFCLGNTIKYIARAGKKDPSKIIEDLKKAAWYLDRAIKQQIILKNDVIRNSDKRSLFEKVQDRHGENCGCSICDEDK